MSPRLPLEPLMKELKTFGTSEFARIIGVSRRTAIRMKKTGLTVEQADRLAIHFANVHPFCIWGWDFYADVLPELDEPALVVAA